MRTATMPGYAATQKSACYVPASNAATILSNTPVIEFLPEATPPSVISILNFVSSFAFVTGHILSALARNPHVAIPVVIADTQESV